MERWRVPFQNAKIERVMKITTPTEADREDAEFWASRNPTQRLEYLEQLRSLWMTDDERRLKRVLEVTEVA